MTNICSASADMLQSRPTKSTPRVFPHRGMSQRSVVPVSRSILTPDSIPVKKSDPKPDLCLFCRDPLDAFGTCRLYSGWAFDLLHCAACGRWYSKPPSKPRGPFLFQAFQFVQIVAFVETMLADELATHQPAKPNVPGVENGGRS